MTQTFLMCSFKMPQFSFVIFHFRLQKDRLDRLRVREREEEKERTTEREVDREKGRDRKRERRKGGAMVPCTNAVGQTAHRGWECGGGEY